MNKGMAYLESVLKCIKESSEPKWSDYFGSVHTEECVKCCFGIFLLLKYKVKDHSNVADAGKLYSILGKGDDYGTNFYIKNKRISLMELCWKKDYHFLNLCRQVLLKIVQ